MSTPAATTGRLDRGLQRSLRWIEVAGNKIPHPVSLFVFLIIALALVSFALSTFDVGATTQDGTRIEAQNLLSVEGLRMALDDGLENFMLFGPFGTVLVIMMGVAVATQTGYLQTLLVGLVRRVPKPLVTFAVSFTAMLAHVAADAAYVIMAPIGATAFYLVGRNPVTGMVLAYVSAGAAYNAAPMVTPSDALFSGVTTEAAQLVEPGYAVTPVSTIFFTAASSVVMALALTLLCETVLERRVSLLGKVQVPDEVKQFETAQPGRSAAQKKGLRWATIAMLGYVALVFAVLLPQGSPLRAEDGGIAGAPVVAGIAILTALMFMIAGLIYGKVAGTITSIQRETGDLMAKGVKDLAPVIALFFFISQFVAYFRWTNLAEMMSVVGANALQALNMPVPLLLTLVIVVVAILNIITLGGIAMYSLTALVLVPMLFSVGVDPETTQTAVRIGDGVTNPMNPLNPYFIWVLTLLKKYLPSAGIGTLASMTVPLAIGAGAIWVVFFLLWTGLGIPLGI